MNNFLTSILLLSLGLACLYGAEASTGSMFNVASSGPNQLKLEVSPAQPGIKETIKDGKTLREVAVPGVLTTATHGMPELPVLSTTIAIPPQGGYTLSYTYSDVELIPLANPLLHENESHDAPAELSPEGFFPAQIATGSEPAILRDFRVIQLNVYPCQYDAANNQLRWYGNIEVTLDFDDFEGVNELAGYAGYSYSFKNLYEAQIANFEDYRNLVTAPAQARILLIHGQSTDSVFLTKLNEFVTWKRQKGYDVTAVSTQVTGTSTSTIKNYIQSQYDDPNTRPDFIILMGDTSGSYAIPTYIENLSGYSGAGDYPYTHLAGSDPLGDVFIGRISAENLAQLTTILAKIYVYERDINIEGDAAAWLDRILLIGDTTYSGISTVYSNKYIREASLLVNPDYDYIENYSGGYSSTMNSGINQGVSFFNYRGYIGMSGWSPSSSLINGPRLPHTVILTCGTGSFNSTSTTEEFIRLGTEAMPKGALTSIGMATSGTHTMFNNALSNGIFDGVFLHGMRSMGEALLNGRLYLWNIYGSSHANQAQYFAHWCNLMGDPTVETFIGIPKQLAISAPDSIPRGTTYVDIAVTDDQMNPEENVSVTLYNSSYGNVVSKGFTNAQGEVTLFIPSFINSEIVITASKHDCKPVQRSLALDQSGSLVYFEKMTIDNGNQGSSGNGDGFIEAGETIALNLEIKNTTAQTITGISTQLSSPDPFVSIGQAQSDYPDITPEGTGLNSTPFLISFGNGISYQHDTRFVLTLTDTNNADYEIIFHLGSFNGNLEATNYSISAGGDGILDPAETGILTVSIKNNSICAVGDIYGELRSLNDLVSVTDSISYFGNAPAGMTINSVDGFSVFARPLLIPGMMIPFSLRLYNSGGFEQTTSFNVPIGTVTQNTPLGPDDYGYFIYDVSDTSYPDCPSYEWIEIVPSLGGSGTQITGLNDSGSSGDEGDQVGSDALETIDLPFTFPFYGLEYNEITVCVNGFIVFGTTENGEFRNGRMPVGLGPSPMIAPFWDDLVILSGGGVYQYYDEDEHIFIIQYNNLKNGYNRTSEETFQVIFYDPVHYPTSLGDGMIKFQYKVFNNIDSGGGDYTPIHGNFCTVGIRDHTNLRGLEYTYNNQYPQAAQPLTNLKALLVTTVPVLQESPHLVVGEMILNDANANSHLEPGETAQIGIKLNNLGLNTATNVNINAASTSPYLSFQNSSSAYPDIPGSGSAVNIYPLEINASMDCADGLVIPIEFAVTIDGGEWFYTMSVTIRKPSIEVSGVYINDIQGNGNGLSDPDETFSMIVNYTNNGSVDATNLTSNITCMSDDVTIHNPEQLIPVIPANTTCQAVYTVTLSPNVTVGNNITFYLTYIGDSIDAQNEQVLLNVGTTGMMEDFETTNGDFLPQPNDNGWQWGVDTTTGAHSGTMVWGTLLNQQYPNNANWTLTSPSVFVGSNFVLEFWHYFNTESNYDGGNVKITTNNGSTWTLITPYGGYNQSNVSALNGPGYAGNSNGWVQARFDLGAFANQSVRFRWVFASDTMIQGQGWYIDDVQTTGFVPFAGKLSGAVASSNPDIDFGSVLIQNPAAIATQPDTEGNYALYLPAGAHPVTASAPGYLSDIYAVDLDIPNPAVEHDYFLGYFSPATGLDYDVEQDTLHLTWAAPADPLYPVLSYKVFKRFNAGAYELMGIYATPEYEEYLTLLGTYRYYVIAVYEDGESLGTDPVEFEFPIVADDDPLTPPLVSRLYQNYPNPFNPSTTIRFDLAKPGRVQLSIYNIRGQLVKTLRNGDLSAGTHSIVWDGRDAGNRSVSSGIYFIRLESTDLKAVRKAIMLK